MKNIIKLVVVVLSVVVLISCKDKATYSKINNTSKNSSSSQVHKVKVNEFLNAGGYTYINVSEDSKTYWMAIPNTKVEVGATYYYNGGMVMKSFESKELNKTFDEIIFSEGISVSESEASKDNVKKPHDHTKALTKEEVIKIDLPENGIAIGDLYSKPESFKNKEIIVKGKVVKVNNGILDKNWVHIVDGTSFENKKDLTITTNETIKVGDTLTFKATVILDKDFGSGYVYALLLENGQVVK